MESSHLVKFSTSGKFIAKFNVLRCISLSETLFWTGARGRIPITLNGPLRNYKLWPKLPKQLTMRCSRKKRNEAKNDCLMDYGNIYNKSPPLSDCFVLKFLFMNSALLHLF